MSYKIEDKDIVISGFEDGIADSPYSGISDMRNIENSSIPGEASVAFKTTNSITQTSLQAQTFTASSSSGLLLTWTGGTALADNTAVTVANTGGTLPTGLSANIAYYVRDSSSTTFRLALTAGGSAIAYTDAGSGTNKFSTIDMGKPKQKATLTTASSSGLTYLYFTLDANGRAWYYYLGSQWVYMNNLGDESSGGGTTGKNGNGMSIYKGTLLVFEKTRVNYMLVASNNVVNSLATLTNNTSWVNNWGQLNAFLQTTQDANVNGYILKSGGTVDPKSLAQSISLPFSQSFSSIVIPLKSTQTFSSALSLKIIADSGGSPTGTTLYTSSNTINVNTLTGSVSYKTFTFSSSITLNQNTTYWVLLDAGTAPSTDGDNVAWMGSPYSIYSYGVPKYKDNADVWQSASSFLGLNTLNLSLIADDFVYPADMSHQAILALDGGGSVYFCNGNAVGSVIETAEYLFNPFDNRTFRFNSTALDILTDDVSNCLVELGTTLLVGGSKNYVYPWDRISPSYNYPIWLAENNVQRMVTVNTNTYIFAGQRGNIYLTNGSQAQLYKKIPDHLSNIPTPYYTWGDVTFTRNKLFFGVEATDNAGTAINQYGGLWSIDLITDALRLINELSYGSYAGIASMIQALYGAPTSDGYGLLIGWDSGVSTYGIDKGSSNPYSGGESYIDTDIIPVGTYLVPFTPAQIEWKTSVPLVAGESVAVYYRLNITDAFTLIPSTTVSFTGTLSELLKSNFQKAQWAQLRVKLTSTNTTPSFCRLTEVRIRNYPN